MKRLTLILSALVVMIVSSFIYLNFSDITESPTITGNQLMNTRLVIVSLSDTACNITFMTGWNLVSFPCLAGDVSFSSFFGNASEYEQFRTYTSADAGDPWKSYNPSLPSWVVQDLPDIARAEGYWIYVTNTTQLYVNSSLGTPTLYDLVSGWNLLGYPSLTVSLVNDTFNQTYPNYDYVYTYNASDTLDPWKEFTWNSSLPSAQDLNYTVPGNAYWIYLLTSDILVIT